MKLTGLRNSGNFAMAEGLSAASSGVYRQAQIGEAMRIGRPKTIVDPYAWLPGYGESNVTIVSEGLSLTIVVRYDREDPSSGEISLAEREFRFEYAPAFLRQPFPGGFSFQVAGDATDLKLGVLTEFQFSEFVDRYLRGRATITSNSVPRMRHFCIQFLSENMDVHVVAADVSLSDEVIVAAG